MQNVYKTMCKPYQEVYKSMHKNPTTHGASNISATMYKHVDNQQIFHKNVGEQDLLLHMINY